MGNQRPAFAILSGTGGSVATFTLPPAMNPTLAGAVLNHAYLTLSGALAITLVSNAESVLLIP